MFAPGHEHAHAHAALGGVLQRLGERRARDEVGGREVERLARGGDREVVERLDVRVADAGARAHDHHRPAVRPRSAAPAGSRRRRAPRRSPPASSPRTRRTARAPPGPRRARACRASGRGPRRRPSTPPRCPTPPVSPTRPSATRILRCVRLASRLRGVRLDGPEAAHAHAGVDHPLEQRRARASSRRRRR